MNQEEAVNVFDLVVKKGSLPATLDKLVPLSFIGSAAVKYYNAKVLAMKQLGIAEGQRKATLADGQNAGDMLLDIEAKIGELIESVPEKEVKAAASRGQRSLPDGVDHSHSARARAIHSHPEAVKCVKKEARENEDIPTRTAVLNKIAYQEEKKNRKRKDRQQSKGEMATGEFQYLLRVERAYELIADPPKQITEQGHQSIVDALTKLKKRIEEIIA